LLDRRGTDRGRSQGITDERYWLRIVNEEIDPGEVRDQTVLRDLQEWVSSPNPSSQLVVGLCGSDDYANRWEHHWSWMPNLNHNRILLLADQVLARLRTIVGVHGTGLDAHPAFLALWRQANRTVQHDDASREWLERQIRLAMPVSLALVIDLYYYWASARYGITRLEDRSRVRRLVHELARAQFKKSDDLIRVIDADLPYTVYQLVFPPDVDDGLSDYRGVEHWSWLGPILLEALRKEPCQFARQIAHLISVQQDGQPLGVRMRVTLEERLSGFFGKTAAEVIRLIAKERENAVGTDRELLDQVVRSAEPFLNSPIRTHHS
jgi:hypothetical protein